MAKKILIIDDEEDFCWLIKKNLEMGEKYEVYVATKGQEGLDSAQKIQPDLILLDIIMPDIQGSDVAREIKNDPNLKDTPIIFLTATTTKEEVDSCRGVIGGYPFIAKPVSRKELLECIEKNLSH